MKDLCPYLPEAYILIWRQTKTSRQTKFKHLQTGICVVKAIDSGLEWRWTYKRELL